MVKETIHAVVFRSEDEGGPYWVAQCLEYSIVMCGEDPEELVRELAESLEVMVEFNLSKGREPFAGFRPAQEKYWRLFEEVKAKSKPVEPKRSLKERLTRFLGRPSVAPRLIFAQAS
ncbi:MAG TPA: hypothetical protein VF789_03620 [Thermoanaerobaculia bacterium]